MELVRTQSSDGSKLRLRKYWHTEFPSIQGPWTPFTFRDPKLNITELPDVSLIFINNDWNDYKLNLLFLQEEVGACPKYGPTATEEIVRLFQEQRLNEKSFEDEMVNIKQKAEHKIEAKANK